MNFIVELDNNTYSTNNNNELYEWLINLKKNILNSTKINISSENKYLTGIILDIFFKEVKILENCKELLCNNNNISFLPLLPNCEGLDCSDNIINFLPELPKCKSLLCFNNNLTKLPELINCINLSCTNNKLKSIENLPNCKWLECNQNNLQKLDFLPNCIDLDCSDNDLSTLSVEQLKKCKLLACKNNPNLNRSLKFNILHDNYFF